MLLEKGTAYFELVFCAPREGVPEIESYIFIGKNIFIVRYLVERCSEMLRFLALPSAGASRWRRVMRILGMMSRCSRFERLTIRFSERCLRSIADLRR